MVNIDFQRYIEQRKLLRKLTDIIKPLESKGLRHFAYNEIYYNGDYSILCGNNDWVKYYFDNRSKLECNLLFMDMTFDKNHTSQIIWNLQDSSSMVKELAKYNVRDGYSLYMKKPADGKITAFHFGSIGKNSEIYRYYLNAAEAFKEFIRYFYAEIGLENLNSMAKFSSKNLKHLMSKYVEDSSLSFDLKIKKYEAEFNSIRQSISKQEYACLNLLAQAKSAKDIGQILHISPRTVETHFLNLKHKYNLRSKDGLLELYKKIP